MPRLMVIGLDGATFSVLELLARDGRLPFLGTLMAEGAHGILRSSDPPYTGPGWSSFMTGTNPGKHSNYDLERRTMDFKGLEPVGYHTLSGTTIWDLANAKGVRTALLNMPISYPPPELKGTVVCGALTPSKTTRFTFPASLAAEIEERFGPYRLDLSWAEYQPAERDRMLSDLEAMMDQQDEVFQWVLQREPWDFGVVVLVAPDRIQHSLWKWIGVDGAIPDEGEQLHQRVLSLYEKIDHSVACLASLAGDDTNLLVVSDHGFNALHSRVDMNNLLAEMGYFVARGGRGFFDIVGRPLHRLGLKRHHLAKIARPFGLKRGFVDSLESGNRLQGAGSITDWSRTRAFCLITNGVFLNLQGREPYGIVPASDYESLRSELIERLQKTCDPATGQRVIFRVQRREEVYSGPFLEYAPDLLITEFDERYHFYFFPKSHYQDSFNPPGIATGNHAYDGILLARGPDIRAGEISGARLMDVMPTMCRLLDLSIPPDVDGVILDAMLTERILKAAPAQPDSESHAKSVARELSQEEREGLEERLRGLGYL